uniref:HIG1 domain-containing protein n=1 Tax=Heterorhabditis bacteriophora TaxID=37862 RepID=A0A1I7W7F1_HETBA
MRYHKGEYWYFVIYNIVLSSIIILDSLSTLKIASNESEGKPLYVTKDKFQKIVMEQRRQTANPEFGQRPSLWQRRFLVLTRMYKQQKDIPEIVANGTMNRMHDRMRVVFIVTAVFAFFSIFYVAELINASKIDHDRNAGVVVTKISTMGFFRKVFMSSAGIHEDCERELDAKNKSYEWKKEHLTEDQLKRTSDNERKYSGIPAIPSDIGYGSGKDIGGKKKSGVISQASGNPGVIVGMGLTTLALLGMLKSSFIGDKLGAQKYMQYRIMAQFFTVTALVAGVTIFGSTYEDKNVTKAKQQNQPHVFHQFDIYS